MPIAVYDESFRHIGSQEISDDRGLLNSCALKLDVAGLRLFDTERDSSFAWIPDARPPGREIQIRSTIFFLENGGNDTELPTKTSISNLENEVRELYAAGARHFMIALLPLNVPKGNITGKRLNPALAKVPGEMAAGLPGIHIVLSKWGPYFDQVMAKHASYGIVNTTDRCAGRALFGEDPTPCSAPDTYFYYHDGHPSTAIHRIVGKYLQSEVEELP